MAPDYGDRHDCLTVSDMCHPCSKYVRLHFGEFLWETFNLANGFLEKRQEILSHVFPVNVIESFHLTKAEWHVIYAYLVCVYEDKIAM